MLVDILMVVDRLGFDVAAGVSVSARLLEVKVCGLRQQWPRVKRSKCARASLLQLLFDPGPIAAPTNI